MDSVALNAELSTYVKLDNDNGSINPTRFQQLRSNSLGYSTTGTIALTCDVVHFKEYVLGGAETITVNLASGLENPVEAAAGNLATLTLFELQLRDNADASATSESIRLGGGSSVPVKLWFGSVSQTMTLTSRDGDGTVHWHSDRGIARGGTLLLIENLDPTNDATFTLLLVGRSA